jgi:hypothetical protein
MCVRAWMHHACHVCLCVCYTCVFVCVCVCVCGVCVCAERAGHHVNVCALLPESVLFGAHDVCLPVRM